MTHKNSRVIFKIKHTHTHTLWVFCSHSARWVTGGLAILISWTSKATKAHQRLDDTCWQLMSKS